MSAHFVGYVVRTTTASMPSRARGRLWEFASVPQSHVHDFQPTTIPTVFVCLATGCGVTVGLVAPKEHTP